MWDENEMGLERRLGSYGVKLGLVMVILGLELEMG